MSGQIVTASSTGKLKIGEKEWTPDQQSRGIGDTIAKATSAMGIRPCGGCKKRQSALNKKLPYKRGK